MTDKEFEGKGKGKELIEQFADFIAKYETLIRSSQDEKTRAEIAGKVEKLTALPSDDDGFYIENYKERTLKLISGK